MKGPPPDVRGCFRFGPFEADGHTGELRKFGVRVKLQSQPFTLLVALLEAPGELLTREDLCRLIWGSETVVDFDRSLSTAINKVRDALGDSADNPRYIETLARRGYRFIAPVQVVDRADRPSAEEPSQPAPEPPPAAPVPVTAEHDFRPAPVPAKSWRTPAVWVALAIFALAAVYASATWLVSGSRGNPVAIRKVTSSSRIYPGDIGLERFAGVVTDGVRVFYSEVRDQRIVLVQTAIGVGEPQRIDLPPEIQRPAPADISADGSRLLVRGVTWSELEQQLWTVPSTGGTARKIPGAVGHDGAWTRSGDAVIVASGRDLTLVPVGSGTPRKLASLPGRAYWIRYSPEGSHLRFTILDPRTRLGSIWEVAADGSGLRRLPLSSAAGESQCCGNWTPDGRYFVYQSSTRDATNIAAVRESQSWWSGSPRPVPVTAGPLQYLTPVPVQNAGTILAIGAQTRQELLRFDSKTNQLVRFLPQLSGALRAELSRDGKLVAWVNQSDGSLWRSNTDGSRGVQLTSKPLQIRGIRWSPDSSKVAFMAREPGQPWRIHIASADGSGVRLLHNEEGNQADPEWSPDGGSMAYGRPPNYMSDDNTAKAIYVVNLKTNHVARLAGSDGYFSPRWSPDGRYIAAMPLDQRRLVVFDRSSGARTDIAVRSVHNPKWTPDSRYLYFQAFLEDEKPVCRVSLDTREVELVTDFRNINPGDTVDFYGLAPGNLPVVSMRFFTADIFAIHHQGL